MFGIILFLIWPIAVAAGIYMKWEEGHKDKYPGFQRPRILTVIGWIIAIPILIAAVAFIAMLARETGVTPRGLE